MPGDAYTGMGELNFGIARLCMYMLNIGQWDIDRKRMLGTNEHDSLRVIVARA